MKHFLLVTFLVPLAAAPAAWAQSWEVGLGAGGSFMTSETISNPLGNASAGRSPAIAASAWLDNNSSGTFGGELRYDYEYGNLKLSSGGTGYSFASMSNAIHYDLVVNLSAKEASVRPFVAAGAGVKIYSGLGAEQALQPLGNIADFSDVRDVRPLASVGGGLKFKISPAAEFRVELHDFLTPFPSKLILPVNGSKVGGWLSDFVIMAGLGFAF
ncbi:MAG TPA: hypothetical protein VMB25_14200 [Bryobacteraceae bacterium]|nr:hypothetical protein [Bryobacteraceae bacterium]